MAVVRWEARCGSEVRGTFAEVPITNTVMFCTAQVAWRPLRRGRWDGCH